MPTKSNNTGGRGDASSGAGWEISTVKDKAENGNSGGRNFKVIDIPEIEGVTMPKPHDFLSAEQRDGSVLQAQEIYTETWQWLKGIERILSYIIFTVLQGLCLINQTKTPHLPYRLPLSRRI